MFVALLTYVRGAMNIGETAHEHRFVKKGSFFALLSLIRSQQETIRSDFFPPQAVVSLCSSIIACDFVVACRCLLESIVGDLRVLFYCIPELITESDVVLCFESTLLSDNNLKGATYFLR